MSSNLVIVAIPAADELVWKVSTEKVPHLTLLFLGPLEQDDNVQRMADFIEHAITVSEHGPFYLDVDHRGTLGSDNADVLFFRDDWSMKWIKSFRGQLLQQNDIRAEWEEMEAAGQQYDEWTPHLTLGYPETPAKPIPDDRSIYSVMFDRIALWTGDYEGPEFRLEWPVRRDDMAYPSLAYSGTSSRGQQFIKSVTHASVLDSPTLRQQIEDKLKDILEDVTGDADGDVALFGDPLLRAKVTSVLNDLYNAGVSEDMAQSAMGEVLTHHGVKGMKWGVRKDHSGSGQSQAMKLVLLGNLSTLSPAFNRYTSTRTHILATLFGPMALTDGAVRADLKQASHKVSLAKADIKWNHALKSGEAYVAVNNVAAEHFNKHIDEVNKKHEGNHDWSNENYANPSQSKDPAFRAYMKDIDKLTQDSIVHASNKLYLKNPSGTKEVEISSSHVGSYNLHVKEVAHATSDQALNIQVKFQHDDQGYVTGFEFDDDAEDLKDGGADEATEMAQSAIQNGSEFVIEHFGVKGMRWGVRKAEYHEAEAAKHVAQGKKKAAAHLLKTGNREEAKAIQDGHVKKAKEHLAQAKEIRAKYAPVEPKATSKIRSGWSKKTQIETDGGENHPAHPDALKVASARAKLKKSGTSALSNQELRDVSTRVLLENQAELLTSHKGKKFVARQLSDTGNTLARAGIRTGVKKTATAVGLAGVAALV